MILLRMVSLGAALDPAAARTVAAPAFPLPELAITRRH
ncbi:hypothetical protein SXIM_02160 [Streptomyces xiamenensis]|uniref:Uncharacterized protein n=1 Tax=Streptomyces xiamenensis TaxID=408015 RepID=A0A0F7FQD5_9ACTN|nr:hypothetical protein SXIM_02160 [Streptomyces xiamenensis]